MRHATPTRAEEPSATPCDPIPAPPADPTGDVAVAVAAVRSVEVVISWGATVLHVGHLTPPRAFEIGEPREDGRPCDCFLPEHALGAPRAPLLKVDEGGGVRLVLLEGATGTLTSDGVDLSAAQARLLHRDDACAGIAGAVEIPLTASARVDLELGGVRLQIGADVAAVERVEGAANADPRPGWKRGLARRRSLTLYCASAALHLGILGALALWASRTPVDEDALSQERIALVQRYLATADEREMEERETEQIAEATADGKEGGTGSRAKGEEGSMGSNSAPASGGRHGVQGPSDSADPHIARQQSLRDATEFGMIGLLNSGAGGDPTAPTAPWGRDDSLGNDPSSARGNLWGDSVGDAFGAGGVGRSGVGEGGLSGGGKRGEGIGLGAIGTIGHGAGAGAGQGFGSGHGRLGGAAQAQLPVAAQAQAQTPPPAYAPAPEEPIDPNGRFATTYRPGGGHLAAFESAVARGIVPAAERELVSDVGARYAPELPIDPDRALAVRPDLERAALAPGGGAFHLRLALRSTATQPSSRPHLSVHLVLDTSGSMAGESIDRARRAARSLVDRLAPTDDFSLTTFSSEAELKIADGPVGPRREMIRRVIDDVREGGGTNIGEGLALGYAQASLPTIPDDAVRVVLLVSDGRATSGLTSGERLSRLALGAFQSGIQTSSFGLGSDYDGRLMSSIAADGAGGYYYLRDPDQIAPALSTELDKRLDPVATAVEVRVRLKKGVQLLRVYGSRRLNESEAARVRTQEVAADVQAAARDHIQVDRRDDNEGGMRFFMPAFARDDHHALLLKLSAGPGVGAGNAATVELKYKDRISKKNVTEEIPITLTYADSDAASAASASPSVARTIQGFAAGETLAEAALRVELGDRDGAAALLGEREGILRQAAASLNEPLFLDDASRLARLRAHTSSGDGIGDPLVLAMLLETAGRSHLR